MNGSAAGSHIDSFYAAGMKLLGAVRAELPGGEFPGDGVLRVWFKHPGIHGLAEVCSSRTRIIWYAFQRQKLAYLGISCGVEVTAAVSDDCGEKVVAAQALRVLLCCHCGLLAAGVEMFESVP